MLVASGQAAGISATVWWWTCIPAGLEIENLNIAQGEAMGGSASTASTPPPRWPTGASSTSSSATTALAAAALQGEINLFYRARVVTPGKFVVPPVHAEDMYRPDTHRLAEGDGSLTVIDGK